MGMRPRLSRPLDFIAIADHSDNMGFFPDLLAGKPHMLANPTAKQWYDMIQSGDGVKAALDIIDKFSRGTFPREIFYAPGMPEYRSAWDNV